MRSNGSGGVVQKPLILSIEKMQSSTVRLSMFPLFSVGLVPRKISKEFQNVLQSNFL